MPNSAGKPRTKTPAFAPPRYIAVEGPIRAGKSSLALPKAVQRDPIKGFIEHVDLIEVRSGEKVTVEISVRIIGDVYPGGMLDQQLVQLPIEAERQLIEETVTADLTEAEREQLMSALTRIQQSASGLLRPPANDAAAG